jgi:hypothetical protein
VTTAWLRSRYRHAAIRSRTPREHGYQPAYRSVHPSHTTMRPPQGPGCATFGRKRRESRTLATKDERHDHVTKCHLLGLDSLRSPLGYFAIILMQPRSGSLQ